MRIGPGQPIRLTRLAIIICVAVVAGGCAAILPGRTSQHQVTLPHATCGSASTHFLSIDTQILSADRGALTCFAAAARRCRPASLHITVMGTDIGTDYVFSIDSGSSACRVSQQRQEYSANFGGSHGPVTTVACRLIAVTGSGVRLGCGDREVLIPARVTAPTPT